MTRCIMPRRRGGCLEGMGRDRCPGGVGLSNGPFDEVEELFPTVPYGGVSTFGRAGVQVEERVQIVRVNARKRDRLSDEKPEPLDRAFQRRELDFQVFEPMARDFRNHGAEQFLLVLEMEVERSLGHFGGSGDVAHPHLLKGPLGEELGGGGEDTGHLLRVGSPHGSPRSHFKSKRASEPIGNSNIRRPAIEIPENRSGCPSGRLFLL